MTTKVHDYGVKLPNNTKTDVHVVLTLSCICVVAATRIEDRPPRSLQLKQYNNICGGSTRDAAQQAQVKGEEAESCEGGIHDAQLV